jgi:hypothetical protein
LFELIKIVVVLPIFFGGLSTAHLTHLVLHKLAFLLFFEFEGFLVFVDLEDVSNFILVQVGDALEKDIQMHADDVWLRHELSVSQGLLIVQGWVVLLVQSMRNNL